MTEAEVEGQREDLEEAEHDLVGVTEGQQRVQVVDLSCAEEGGPRVEVVQPKVADVVYWADSPKDTVETTQSFTDAHVPDQGRRMDPELLVSEDCETYEDSREHGETADSSVDSFHFHRDQYLICAVASIQNP
jgi:hypothetical protein